MKTQTNRILTTLPILAALALLSLSAIIKTSDASMLPEQSSCVQCHQNDVDDDHTALVEGYLIGAHAKRGVTCADCHGGDPTLEDGDEAMDEALGFIGIPERHEIPKFCGKCHSNPEYMRGFDPNIATDQYSKYMISGHGKRLAKSRDDKVAVCTSCHGVHGILPADNPNSPTYAENIPETCGNCHGDAEYMEGRDIPTDQNHQYEQSVHGQALLEKGDRAAPACSDCHGNHEARIPDPSGVANTCAQCHNFIRDLFVASPHKQVHEENNYPECEVCHGNHSIVKPYDGMLSQAADDGGVCAECHENDSKGMLTAIAMRHAIDSLRDVIDSARAAIAIADEIGLDVEEVKFTLSQAQNELHTSRTLVHSFDAEQVTEVTTAGMTIAQEASATSAAILDHFDFRRNMFFVSVVVILILSALLTMKIRALGKGTES